MSSSRSEIDAASAALEALAAGEASGIDSWDVPALCCAEPSALWRIDPAPPGAPGARKDPP